MSNRHETYTNEGNAIRAKLAALTGAITKGASMASSRRSAADVVLIICDDPPSQHPVARHSRHIQREREGQEALDAKMAVARAIEKAQPPTFGPMMPLYEPGVPGCIMVPLHNR